MNPPDILVPPGLKEGLHGGNPGMALEKAQGLIARISDLVLLNRNTALSPYQER